VYYHGGGWVIGNLDTHDGSARGICNASACVVVSVDYRLAPEHRFPVPAEDAYSAAKWISDHVEEFGAQAPRLQVAIAGESAGGNLAAAVALMAKDRGGPQFFFQLLVYPVMDYGADTPSYRENGEGYFLTKSSMDWYWGHYLKAPEDGSHPYASPLKAEDLSGLPPALVITAEYDPLRDEGEAYASRLKEAGVPAICTRYPGMMHGFFNQPNDIDDARKAYAEAGAALKKALNP
jgi:acetyl esterase